MTKVAIVTGGNKGVGFGVVKGLAKVFDGDVFLTARNVERGMAAVKLLEQENITDSSETSIVRWRQLPRIPMVYGLDQTEDHWGILFA